MPISRNSFPARPARCAEKRAGNDPGRARIPMDVLRTGVSFLGNIEPEGDFSNQAQLADKLLACLPSMLLYWHRFHTDGIRIDVETDDDSVAGHFLHMLHDKPPASLHKQSLNTTLILYAEHEFNASTFAARVITGTLVRHAFRGHRSDRRVARSIAWRRQRGGNGADPEIRFTDRGDCRRAKQMLANKDKIMGFGHRVYTTSDPRNSVNKKMSKVLAEEVGDTQALCHVGGGRERSCGTRRNCSPMPIFSLRAFTISWAFRPICSRLSSSAHASRAGLRTCHGAAIEQQTDSTGIGRLRGPGISRK